jgi:hypothetical protein
MRLAALHHTKMAGELTVFWVAVSSAAESSARVLSWQYCPSSGSGRAGHQNPEGGELPLTALAACHKDL